MFCAYSSTFYVVDLYSVPIVVHAICVLWIL